MRSVELPAQFRKSQEKETLRFWDDAFSAPVSSTSEIMAGCESDERGEYLVAVLSLVSAVSSIQRGGTKLHNANLEQDFGCKVNDETLVVGELKNKAAIQLDDVLMWENLETINRII